MDPFAISPRTIVASMAGAARRRLRGTDTIDIGDHHLRFVTDDIQTAFVVSFVFKEERPIYNDLVGRLDDETVFYDVGANFGLYTVLAGRITDQTHAVEPDQAVLPTLRRNLDLNDVTAHIHECGLGREKRQVALEKGINPGAASIGDTGGDVILQTFDTLLEDNPAPDIVKIDVEGHGPAVLEGMTETIETEPMIYIETHKNKDAITEILEEYDYDVDVLHERSDAIFYRAEAR